MNRRLAEITTAVNRNLSENVRQLMQQRDITHARMAHELGYANPTTVYDRLSGRGRWRVPEVLFLLELFDISVDDLLRGPETPS